MVITANIKNKHTITAYNYLYVAIIISVFEFDVPAFSSSILHINFNNLSSILSGIPYIYTLI